MTKEKIYHVTVPLTGSLFFIIKGKENMSEEEIFEKCSEEYWNLRLEDNPNVELGQEFELHRQINRGNVCYATCREMDFYIEDEEE